MRYTILLMQAVSILGLLMSSPMHGYEIRKQLSELLSLSTAISYGSLYPNLAKLHRLGLIESTTGEAPLPKTATKPTSNKQIFSTGSLSGDIAFETKNPFFRSSHARNSKKTKKVYLITPKGEKYFLEKLVASFSKNANDDKTFVVHLAFLHNVDNDEKNIFFTKRISALKTRLDSIAPTENHELKLWRDVERKYINNQIDFLESLKTKEETHSL